MSLTPNFGFNIPDSTDIVNLLTQCYPNFTIADTALQAVKETGVTVATESKAGTVHNLVRNSADCALLWFTATSNYVTGDTFTVDGSPVSAVKVSGAGLETGDFVINSNVLAIVKGAVLTVLAGGGSSQVDAQDVDYDNTGSGLTATDVQNAIDELAGIDAGLRNDVDANTAAIAAIVPGSKITRLYTNANPDTGMAENTQVTLSSADYDILVWVFEPSSAADDVTKSAISIKGESVMFDVATTTAQTNLQNRQRIMNYASDTSYTSGPPLRQNNGAARSTDTTACVPKYVYGIKI